MEFFCFHRDRPGSSAVREATLEAHWSYMDGYAAHMIARGPTLDGDGTPTGSVHVLELPDPAAARAFAFDEPTYQAGGYRDVLLRRWRSSTPGATMADSPGERSGYLVLGLGEGGPVDVDRPAGHDLIAHGSLVSDDGATWLGTAALTRAPGPDAARALLTQDRYAAVEVRSWQFGGRR